MLSRQCDRSDKILVARTNVEEEEVLEINCAEKTKLINPFQDLCTDESTKRIADRLTLSRLPALGFVDLFLTERCNHACSYCFVKGKRQFAVMHEDVAKASVDFLLGQLGSRNDAHILLFGGEPFIQFGLVKKVVEYAEERAAILGKKLHFHTTSNGTLCKEEVCRFCRQHNIKILLSLDGDKESHDMNRRLLGRGSSFDLLMRNLPLLKRYQPWQGTRMTLTPRTVGRLRHNVEYLYGLGINQFIVGPATGIRWTDDDLRTFEEQMCLVADLYNELKSKKAPFRMGLFETDLNAKPSHLRGVWGCGAGRGRICVSTTGEIYGCAKILGVDGMRGTHKLGDIWMGFTNLKRRLSLLSQSPYLRPKCLSCNYSDDCAGGCPATNYEATGSIYYPSELDCKMKPIIERIKGRLKPQPSQIDDFPTAEDVCRNRTE